MSQHFLSAEELYEVYLKHPSVVTDSREVTEGSLFFALRGDNFNGNIFAPEALNKGAAFAVVDDARFCKYNRCLTVKNTLSSLQKISELHRSSLNLRVIGITGSNGKTTTKELINGVLSQKFNTISTRGNLNNHIGVPLTILRADRSTEILIVEMGANHPGEITFLCELAKPTCGIITNIGKAHLEGFGTPEGVVKAKGELYDFLGRGSSNTIIVNAVDPLLYTMAFRAGVHLVSYGASESADVQGEPEDSGLFLQLYWYHDRQKLHLKTKLAGAYNFTNVMAAIATGIVMGVEAADIAKAIQAYQPVNNRSQYHETGNNSVIIDCYNANPASMKEAIDHFLRNSRKPGCMILGDMFELGIYSDSEHRLVAEMAQGTGNVLICVGEHFSANSGDIADHIFTDTDALIPWLKSNPLKGYSILLKGSRGMGLERVLEYL